MHPHRLLLYSGEALDKKTPLLRSMEAINKQALRILRCSATPRQWVNTTWDRSRSTFLIDQELSTSARSDLLGRTLFGASPPKGQELEDHYFGTL